MGTELYLINEGPDEPFGGGTPRTDFAAATPQTTGQVMKFRVVPLAVPRDWDDAITENPVLGSIEIWEIYNFTQDAHPIHIHEVQFQVGPRKIFEIIG